MKNATPKKVGFPRKARSALPKRRKANSQQVPMAVMYLSLARPPDVPVHGQQLSRLDSLEPKAEPWATTWASSTRVANWTSVYPLYELSFFGSVAMMKGIFGP